MFITRCRPISEPAPQGYISKTRKHRKSPVRWRGGGFENAIERSIAYLKEGGVDAIWVNTLRKREEIGEACRRIPGPVIAPYYGPQPSPTFDEFQKLGAAAVLYPSLTTAAGVQATWEVLNEFKERGQVVLEEWNNKGLASKYGAVPRYQDPLLPSKKITELEERFIPKELTTRLSEHLWSRPALADQK